MNMNDDVLIQREQISALADGQLRGEGFAAAVEAACAQADARESWHMYHLVGDVLRSRELAGATRDHDFVVRLSQRLQAEVVRPAQPDVPLTEAGALRLDSVAGHSYRDKQAANEASFRWKLVAGFASLAAVAAIAWNVGGFGGAPAGAQLAQSFPAAPAAVVLAPAGVTAGELGGAVMMRDPRLDELLAAHRQFGGASALQNPSGFLRNATFEGPAR